MSYRESPTPAAPFAACAAGTYCGACLAHTEMERCPWQALAWAETEERRAVAATADARRQLDELIAAVAKKGRGL